MSRKDTKEGEMPEFDTLKVRAQIPISTQEGAMRKDFVNKAVDGKQGRKKTVFIEHGDDDDVCTAYAVKNNPLSRWALRITAKGKDYSETLGVMTDIKGVKEAAAAYLAEGAMEASDHLKHVKEHSLAEGEIVGVGVGQSYVLKVGEEDDKANDLVVFEGEVPMPPEFDTSFDRFTDTARVDDDAGTVTMGDDVSGKVYAERGKKGSWLAVGQGDYNYERKFDRTYETDHVVHELAEDMAANELSEDAILKHIRRHKFSDDQIDFIETKIGGVVYDSQEPDMPEHG